MKLEERSGRVRKSLVAIVGTIKNLAEYSGGRQVQYDNKKVNEEKEFFNDK